jgi:hypothetical protein
LGELISECLGAGIFDRHFALADIFGYNAAENDMMSLQGI